MRVLHAIDLDTWPHKSLPFDVSRAFVIRTDVRVGSARASGFATPMGFWFVDEPVAQAQRVLRLLAPGEYRAQGSTAEYPAAARPLPAIHFHSMTYKDVTIVSEEGLHLEIGPDGAVVGIVETDWEQTAGAVLTAVSQCWRFFEIERRLDELNAWLRGRPADSPKLRTILSRRRRAEIRSYDLMMRRVIVDLPRVEAPLTDPGGAFASDLQARLYCRIVRRLGLRPWRNLIDERVEALEAAIAARVERHGSFDQIAIELFILVALVADLGFHAVMALWE